MLIMFTTGPGAGVGSHVANLCSSCSLQDQGQVWGLMWLCHAHYVHYRTRGRCGVSCG